MAHRGSAEVVRDACGRRVLEIDRGGTRVAELAWRDDGALARAAVRIPDGTWLAIEPRAAGDAPWGVSDRLRHGGAPLGLFAALDWARLDRIPPATDPARLPPGAAGAVLNLLAQLAADQGRAWLRYDGPWPSETLFLALLESFRYDEAAAGPDPLAAFMAGDLAWAPAPHERCFAAEGVCVQWRGRVERVAAGGRAYWRPDWQGVRRHAPRRVRDAGGTVRCSLWALGEVLEDHLVLSPAGDVLEVLPSSDAPGVCPVPSPVVAGLAEAVVATSAAALASGIRAEAAALTLAWGPVDRDLAHVGAGEARVSNRLRALLSRRLDASASRAEDLGLGLAVLGEIAQLVGDALRARAQARLAGAPADAQARALAAPPAAPDAARIAAAADALVSATRER